MNWPEWVDEDIMAEKIAIGYWLLAVSGLLLAFGCCLNTDILPRRREGTRRKDEFTGIGRISRMEKRGCKGDSYGVFQTPYGSKHSVPSRSELLRALTVLFLQLCCFVRIA